jgi:hypothetical protein
MAVIMSGVLPSMSLASIFAPASRRRVATSVCPFSQEVQDFQVAEVGGVVERRGLVLVFQVDVRALLNEIPGHIDVARFEGEMKGCFLILIRAVQPFGVAFEERLDLRQVAASDGVVDLVRRSGEGE